MIPTGLLTVSDDGHEVLHHLLIDTLIKGAIVLSAVIVLVLGMALIWKKAARPPTDETTLPGVAGSQKPRSSHCSCLAYGWVPLLPAAALVYWGSMGLRGSPACCGSVATAANRPSLAEVAAW